MKKPVIMIISVILLIMTIVFTLQNAEEVEINYFFWHGSVSLALLLFVTLGVGMVTAIIILVPVIAHLKKARIEKDKVESERISVKKD